MAATEVAICTYWCNKRSDTSKLPVHGGGKTLRVATNAKILSHTEYLTITTCVVSWAMTEAFRAPQIVFGRGWWATLRRAVHSTIGMNVIT